MFDTGGHYVFMSEVVDWSIVGVLIPIGAIWAVIEYRRQRRGSAVLQSGQRVSITYPSPGTRSWPPGWYGLLLGAVLAPAGLTTAGLGSPNVSPRSPCRPSACWSWGCWASSPDWPV